MLTANTTPESSTTTLAPSPCQSSDSARARLVHNIRIALRRSGHAALRGVEVTVDGESIVMTGQVPTFYLKQLSQELARSASPRHKICNAVTVYSADH